MQRTVNIPNDLLEMLESAARREGITIDALLERTLRQAVGGPRGESAPSGRIEPVVVRGDGPREGLPEEFWDDIRDFAYDDPPLR